MSFILDALQKSERERHAGQAPAIDEALTRPLPEPRRRGRNDEMALVVRTALIVSAVFLIAGLTWWLLSRHAADSSAAPAEPPVIAAAPAPSAAPGADLPPIPAPAPGPALRIDPERLQAPVAAADLGPDAASLDELLDDTPEPELTAAPAFDAPAVDATPAPAVEAEAAPAAKTIAARPLKDMPPSFRSEFPALSVQVHVYDPNPLRRFVLVNGKKYRETDTLVEGPQLVEIVEDGIVLEQRGTRVLLEMPR
ncbi:MAG: general secretion pathway protein GspB [Stagnimonas sp.]|nr:general secretion pathway protein GspB [Stagnimonas sp.]